MLFDRSSYDEAVRRAVGGESHVWAIAVGILSGVVPWMIRSAWRGDVGVPEVMDFSIAVAVGTFMEVGRRFASRVRGGYEVYRKLARRAEADEAALRNQIQSLTEQREQLQARVSELSAALADRLEHQSIADALTEEHELAIRLFMHRDFDAEASTDSERDALFRQWERDVAAWSERLFARMEALGCTKQELHGVRTFGGWPFIQFHRFHHWSNAKSLLKFRLDRLADVSTARAERALQRRAS
jgi:hypothetical protein